LILSVLLIYIFLLKIFLENQLRDNKDQKQLERNTALLAVVANSYSNNHDVFVEHVNNTVFPELSKVGQQRNQVKFIFLVIFGG